MDEWLDNMANNIAVEATDIILYTRNEQTLLLTHSKGKRKPLTQYVLRWELVIYIRFNREQKVDSGIISERTFG